MSKIGGDNKAIKFPEAHYVGFQSRPSSDNVPLGFMTPDGTDAAAKKRKESVDKWAVPYHYHGQAKPETIQPVSYKNEPMVGFKLSREIKRSSSFGSGNVKWRIEDPRGFELEISSPNFAQILMLCTMERGEIQEQLIWGRLGAENILVPVNSDVYKTAQANTERVAKKASLKDLNIGDEALMQNGDKGVYMGTFYFIRANTDVRNFGAKITQNKRYVFKMQDKRMDGIGSPKISEITPGEKVGTQEESEKLINDLIKNKKNFYISDNSNDYSKIVAVTSKKPSDGDITMTEHTASFEDLEAHPTKYSGVVGFYNRASQIYAFDTKSYGDAVQKLKTPSTATSSIYRQHDTTFWIYEYESAEFAKGNIVPREDTRYSYHSTVGHTIQPNFFTGDFTYFTFTAKTEFCGEYELSMTKR